MPPVLPNGTSELARFLNTHRFSSYALCSLLAVSFVLVNALKSQSNFYSVAIYLSRSSRGVLVLANFGVLLSVLCGHAVQRVFFGPLRANEIERLYDRLWFFITESLLAFTIFRDEFDTPFVLMFGFLLFVKSFHWLASDRIEWMDQQPYPGPPLLFHFRMTVLLSLLWITDCVMFLFAIEHTLSVGVGGMVLFASEYGILMASVMNTIAKYVLSAYDLRRAGRRGGENAPPWENRSVWLFYIELTTDFLKLSTYLVFFIVIMTFYGIPLNIVRDVYITGRSFVSRLRAMHRYQTATRNMDQRYPNATEAELHAMTDRTCIICREEMALPAPRPPDQPNAVEGPNTTPKKLPCGHIFHFYCLRSWLERQQSCPTCRRNVLDDTPPPPQPLPAAGNPPVANNMADGNPAGNNNAFGLLGRLFGPPRAPNPAVAVAQNGPIQPGGALHNQQGGIVINYQVQYQFPRVDTDDRTDPDATRPRRPLPPFTGFPGPDGVWQEWPGQGTPDNAEITPPLQPNERVADASESLPTSSPKPASKTSPSQPSSTLGPREAAALAALERFGGKDKTDGPQIGGKDKTDGPQKDHKTSSEPQPESRPSTSTTAPSPSVAPHVPRLIPLWHLPPDTIASRLSPNTTSPPASGLGVTRSYIDELLSAAPRSQLPSLADLPPSLTDEQLSHLDRLTREAIDERLRILEGVSGAVYRCVEDLMRLRSALPSTPNSNGSQDDSSSQSETVPFTSKGKDPEARPSTSKVPEKSEPTDAGWSFDEESDSS